MPKVQKHSRPRSVARSVIALLNALLIGTPTSVFAQGPSLQNSPMIFDVRRSLPLEPDEPVYHDFYINAGLEAGFKKGMYITVVRIVPVHDPVQNKQQGELQVGVARLHVIHAARSLTVARLDSEFTDEERPTLDFESVMIGDRIDPLSMTMDSPNIKKKPGRKSPQRAEVRSIDPEAQASAKVPAPATSTAPAPSLNTPAASPSGATPGGRLNQQAPKVEPAIKTTTSLPNSQDLVRVPIPSTSAVSDKSEKM